MRSKTGVQETDGNGDETDIETDAEPSTDADEPSDLGEADLQDDQWDVFILDDDDCDPLPDYGDFWMPD